MNSITSDWLPANTQDGMLAAFGEFLKRHGMIDRLMGMRIQQEARRFAPQSDDADVMIRIAGMNNTKLAVKIVAVGLCCTGRGQPAPLPCSPN